MLRVLETEKRDERVEYKWIALPDVDKLKMRGGYIKLIYKYYYAKLFIAD